MFVRSLANLLHCAADVEVCGLSITRQLCHVLCPAIVEKTKRYVKQFNAAMKDCVSNDDWSATQVVMGSNRSHKRRVSVEDQPITVAPVISSKSTTGGSLRGAGAKVPVVEETVVATSGDSLWLTRSGRYLYEQGIAVVSDCKRLLLPAVIE